MHGTPNEYTVELYEPEVALATSVYLILFISRKINFKVKNGYHAII